MRLIELTSAFQKVDGRTVIIERRWQNSASTIAFAISNLTDPASEYGFSLVFNEKPLRDRIRTYDA